MKALKNKILEGFFNNVGADPYVDWIHECFKSFRCRYAKKRDLDPNSEFHVSTYYISKSERTPACINATRISKNSTAKEISFDIDLHKIPEILKINPHNLEIYTVEKARSSAEVELIFCELKRAIPPSSPLGFEVLIYDNVVSVTVHKKTGVITSKTTLKEMIIT